MNYIQSNINYHLVLRTLSEFDIRCIFSSFYASRAYIRTNVNWLRQDLTAAGLFLLCLRILISPDILSQLNVGLGSLNVRVPVLISRVIRNFLPLSRANENYFTCATESFHDVKEHVKFIISQIDDCLSDDKEALTEYQVPGLADSATLKSQLRRVKHVLEVYSRASSPAVLAQELLVTLQALKNFEHDAFPFEQLDAMRLSPLSGSQIPYGIRKYVRVGSRRVSFIGEPSQLCLSTVELFIDRMTANLDSTVTVDVNSPIIGGSTIIVDDLKQGDWLLSLLNSEIVSVTPGDSSLKRAKSELGSVRVNSRERVRSPSPRGLTQGARNFNTLSAGLGANQPKGDTSPGRLYRFDGKEFHFLGFLAE